MNLQIFPDNACDYVLEWLVADKDAIDQEYVDAWTKHNAEFPEHQLDIYASVRAYEVIASFRNRSDAE